MWNWNHQNNWKWYRFWFYEAICWSWTFDWRNTGTMIEWSAFLDSWKCWGCPEESSTSWGSCPSVAANTPWENVRTWQRLDWSRGNCSVAVPLSWVHNCPRWSWTPIRFGSSSVSPHNLLSPAPSRCPPPSICREAAVTSGLESGMVP